MDLALQSGVTTVRHRSGGRAEGRQYRLPWLIQEIKRLAKVVTPDGPEFRKKKPPAMVTEKKFPRSVGLAKLCIKVCRWLFLFNILSVTLLALVKCFGNNSMGLVGVQKLAEEEPTTSHSRFRDSGYT